VEVSVGNTISDAAIMAALGRQMNRAVARETIATSNLANLDTPGYHTREVTFDQALTDSLGTGSTGSGLAPGSIAQEGKVGDAEGLAERRDGNNVQLDRELLNLNVASGDFSAAQAVLSAKFRLVRYAINDGR
jgi:flagellar basal-body rod protein FlgB